MYVRSCHCSTELASIYFNVVYYVLGSESYLDRMPMTKMGGVMERNISKRAKRGVRKGDKGGSQ